MTYLDQVFFSNPNEFILNQLKKLGFENKNTYSLLDTLIDLTITFFSLFWIYQFIMNIMITCFRRYYLNKVSNPKLVFNLSIILFFLWLMLIPLFLFNLFSWYGLIIIPLMFIKLLLFKSKNSYTNINIDEMTMKIDHLVEEIQKNEKNIKVRITKIDALLTYKTTLLKLMNNTNNLNLSYVLFNLMFIFDKYSNLNEKRANLMENEFTQVYKHLALLK